MKKLILLLLCTASFTLVNAQDDMYFTPKKKSNAIKSSVEQMTSGDYSDVIDFEIGSGLYPDSLSVYDFIDGDSLAMSAEYFDDDDFRYTRRMGRFDDFYGYYDPYYYDFYHNPYLYPGYYSWYDPWTYRWYNPWRYAWNYGFYGYYGYDGLPYYYNYAWGLPFGYGYYGWYHNYNPIYYGNAGWAYRGHSGTANHWGRGRAHNEIATQTYSENRSGNFGGNRATNNRNVTNKGISQRQSGMAKGSRIGGTMRRTGTTAGSNNRQYNNNSNSVNTNSRSANRDFDAVNNGPRSMGSYNSSSSSSGSSRSGSFSGGGGGTTRSGGGHFGGRR